METKKGKEKKGREQIINHSKKKQPYGWMLNEDNFSDIHHPSFGQVLKKLSVLKKNPRRRCKEKRHSQVGQRKS